MKRIIVVFVCLIIIILIIFFNWYITKQNQMKEINIYNNYYMSLLNDKKNEDGSAVYKTINGVELTTLINKAIDNNEKYKIKKDKNGAYILNNESSIEIYIQLEEGGAFYLMEAFQLSGMTSFTTLYGAEEFKCTNIDYHKNGKISKLEFQIIK